jgi:hypothetical protein
MLKLDSFMGATQKIKSYDRMTEQRWARLPPLVPERGR